MKYDFGLLAIGDEITDGDIVNTNTAAFASFLTKEGFKIGNHICCEDDKNSIFKAIEYLIKDHSNLMTIGGLGPTEDDITTESIAEFFKKTLFTDERTWDALRKRMIEKYNKIPRNNNKQAMFPDGATIIRNENGTANGFRLEFASNRFIYVFPGPPKECIPMLEKLNFNKKPSSKQIIRQTWKVYNIGESFLAEKLDIIKDEYSFVTFKYRIAEGFIELKYFYPQGCPHSKDIINKVEKLLETHLNLDSK